MKTLVNFAKSFDFLEITSEEVLKELNSLDPTSSKGAVGIETKIFKQCANELAKPLADLFNNCIKNNFIPLEWKLAHLTRPGTLSFLCQKRKKHALFSLFFPKT